ncbi:MAG: pitrilysin family protein [Pirellulaceae bacterium]|nr:insulinase family protein [Planctomycetales bacterium]
MSQAHVPQEIESYILPNGLTLVAERMDWVESAAFTLLLPAGCGYDPPERAGLANLVCEMVQRGAGDKDSRAYVEALDRLGVDRSASVSQSHTSFAAAMLAENLQPTLAMYADLLRCPHLPEDQLDDSKQVCYQEIQAFEDDLAQRTMQRLRHQSYGEPWGRSPHGERETVAAVSLDDVHTFVTNSYLPERVILSVAGNFRWSELRNYVTEIFGDWPTRARSPLAESPPSGGYWHIEHESSQTHIGVSYPSVPYRHPDYFQARGAVGVLSDGMSSRLFTEVRERRGLCYTVFASYHSLPERGRVMCYAGTSTDRAQETLDVMVAELRKIAEGIDPDELRRLQARVKSALIMQQESSTARSGAMAGDWYHLGRVRTMDEIRRTINGLSCDSINRYLAEHPPDDFVVVTLGAEPLEVKLAVS